MTMADIVNVGMKVDTSQVEKGYSRLKRMQGQADKTESELSKMTRTATATAKSFATLATAVVGATSVASALVFSLGNTERELQASARMAGLTTDQFEAMSFAYRQFGLTVEQVNDIYKDSRERVGEWLSAQSGALQDFGDVMGMSKGQITEFAKEVDGLTGQQLLQRMVDEMQAAGVSANQMSFALEGMASEATRMIPALVEGGSALERLTSKFNDFNSQFSLNEQEVQNYRDLTESFDLLFAVVENGTVKAMSPLAQSMSDIADEITALIVGAESAKPTIQALENSFSVLLAMGGAYAAFTGGKMVASMVASIGATERQIAANLALEASEKKELATKLAADEAKIASEVRLLKMQQTLNKQRIIATKSESQLSSLRSVQSKVTQRLAAAESALAVAKNKTSVATANVNTATMRSTAAMGAATTGAVALTTATRALSTATNFLLGPWGLLLTGVGLAAATFIETKNSADRLNETLDKQKESVNKLIEGYQDLNDQGIRNLITNLNNEMSGIRQQIMNTQRVIESQRAMMSSLDPSGRADARKLISESEEKVKSLRGQLDLVSKAQQEIFDFKMPDAWKSLDDVGDDVNKTTTEINKQLAELDNLQASLGMTSDELFVFQHVQRSIANGDAPKLTAQIREQAEAYIWLKNQMENQSAYDTWVSSIANTMTEAEKLEHQIAEVWSAILSGDLDENSEAVKNHLEGIFDQLDNINKQDNPFDNLASGATQSLSAIQRLATDGTDAYKQLERAINAVNLAQSLATGNIAGAIGAGVGLLMTFDKEIKDFSADIQANQNLNIWGDKADSIAEATDITAQATEKLVGINSDMLDALKVVRQGISGASGLIARDKGSAQVNVGGLGIIGNPLTDTGIGKFLTKGLDLNILNILSGGLLSGLGKALGGLLGGSSKVIDEGVQIIGGMITDLTDEILVQSFQTVGYKKHKFGSTKYSRAVKTLNGEVSNQFSLVFGSIIDSVAAGAGALGISEQQIQKAIDEFGVNSAVISLKGMSQSRQQKALEAYFSRVFNSLASEVIPFLDEFQKAGEELGETLSRLATEVSVAEYLVDNLGVTFADKMANPKAFAQAADNLATLAGGAEKLIDQVSSFTDTFASDTQKFDIYKDALSEALNEVGLKLPSSAQGFFDLMSTLDGTTEAGQRQIATLLSLTDTADGYFRILDRSVGKFRDAAKGLFEVTEASRVMSIESALAAARLGDFSLAEQLELGSIGPQSKDFSSRLEYNLARAETAAKLNELADLQSGQVSVDEKQLTVLEQIRDKLSSNGTMNQSEVAERVGKLEVTMKKLITESNDYLRRSAYQGA